MAEHKLLGRLRNLCLSLPEVSERNSWGHPCFLAGRKTFVAFENFQKRPSVAFRAGEIDIQQRVSLPGFFVTPYGRGQWFSMWATGSCDWDLAHDLVLGSYRLVALRRMLVALDRLK